MVHNHMIRIPFLVYRMSSEKLNNKQQFQFPPLPPPQMQFMQPKMIQDATNFKVWFGSDCCIPSLPHSGQSIHAPHDRWGGKKISKLNIPLTVIVSVCCARTDCSVLLPCWKAVYFSSLPLLFYVSLSSFFPHYCNMALSISLSVCAVLRYRRPVTLVPGPLVPSGKGMW